MVLILTEAGRIGGGKGWVKAWFVSRIARRRGGGQASWTVRSSSLSGEQAGQHRGRCANRPSNAGYSKNEKQQGGTEMNRNSHRGFHNTGCSPGGANEGHKNSGYTTPRRASEGRHPRRTQDVPSDHAVRSPQAGRNPLPRSWQCVESHGGVWYNGDRRIREEHKASQVGGGLDVPTRKPDTHLSPDPGGRITNRRTINCRECVLCRVSTGSERSRWDRAACSWNSGRARSCPRCISKRSSPIFRKGNGGPPGLPHLQSFVRVERSSPPNWP